MKKIIFGIFAHPDDEAFGTAGTLLMETKDGNDLHLVTLTLGDAGTNPDNVPNLAEIRDKEWRTAGALIGAKDMHFLGYKDGQLNNIAMLEIYDKLLTLVANIVKHEPHDVEIEFISMDTNGITGHIDHMIASRSACYTFYKMKERDKRVTRIRLACIPKSDLPQPNTNWLYMDAGRDDSEIGEIIDARYLHDEIIPIVRAHHSQRNDGEMHIREHGDRIGLSYFIVKN
ncbi:MAG: PIG-L family deacetylase [Candidatus Saccharimonadales bacterium]